MLARDDLSKREIDRKLSCFAPGILGLVLMDCIPRAHVCDTSFMLHYKCK